MSRYLYVGEVERRQYETWSGGRCRPVVQYAWRYGGSIDTRVMFVKHGQKRGVIHSRNSHSNCRKLEEKGVAGFLRHQYDQEDLYFVCLDSTKHCGRGSCVDLWAAPKYLHSAVDAITQGGNLSIMGKCA